MYFGNTDGLLEFDGVLWRHIVLPNASTVRSLALSDDGVVYVGGQNEAGYLAAGGASGTRFVSILDRLDPSERKFGDVWSIVATPAGIYFSTSERLILWNPKSGVKLWKAGGRFRRAYWIDGAIHVRVAGIGLHRVEGEELRLAPGGEHFRETDIRGIFRNGRGLAIATNKGVFLKSGGDFSPLVFPAEKKAAESSLYSVAQLSNNLLALGTVRGGLVLTDADGQSIRVLNTENGLSSDYIAAIAPDRQGGVWLATGNGIVRFSPRLTDFSENNGLRGAVTSLARWRGTLYAGTSSGLFRLNQSALFEPIPLIKDHVFVLLANEDSLWIGSQRGLYRLNGNERNEPEMAAAAEVVYHLSFSPRDPATLYTAGRTGATVFRLAGNSLERVAELPSKGEEFRTVAEDDDGAVWLTTRSNIVRADFRSTPPQVKTYTQANGVPNGWKNVFRIGDRLVFATEKGLRKFSPDDGNFIPDPSFGKVFADGSHGVLLMREDHKGNVWISGSGFHGLLSRAFQPDADWRPMPFIAAGLEELWAEQTDADGVVWASGPDGRLIRLDPALASVNQQPLQVLIRRLMISENREPLFEGFGSPGDKIRVGYRGNSLRAEFAAPFYDAPDRVKYRASYSDSSAARAPWSIEAWKDLSNLWEGNYRLRVRAESPYGQVTGEAVLPFTVEPPWYRSWWAYALYLFFGAALVWLLLRWRLRQLRESNRRLELLVDERTGEIRRQRDQILEQEQKTEALLLNILPAPVAEELRSNGVVAPMYFDDVTVCFTDFVGFTISSERLEAGELVAQLHEYFTEFDKIVTRYGLEKLKTIGDSYMFVSGLPEPSPTHAADAVLASLEIVQKVKELGVNRSGSNWRLRVGIHSGPVVAGVVGLKKFAFDIWGDTVNLASRMESSGVPGQVNISRKTFEAIKDVIECEPRGFVNTKDGRDLEMFFALCPKVPETSHESKSQSTIS